MTDVVLIVPEIPHSCFKNYYNLESIKLVLTYFFELSSSGSRVSFNGQLGASNRTKANSIEINLSQELCSLSRLIDKLLVTGSALRRKQNKLKL